MESGLRLARSLSTLTGHPVLVEFATKDEETSTGQVLSCSTLTGHPVLVEITQESW